MIDQTYRVNGDETIIHYVDHFDDLPAFLAWADARRGVILGLDTETTGLHIFGAGFRCRLVQFGDAREAWVIPVEGDRPYHQRAVTHVLRDPGHRFVAHNAPFDLLVLDRTGFCPLEELVSRVFDTYILAHLIDPRTEADGGPGLSLKPLSTIYVDPDAADTQKDLYAVFHKEYKATKATGWALIDIDHPLYTLYAGLDVIYVTRLLAELGLVIKARGNSKLAHFEHDVQRITTGMQKRGLLIDTEYTPHLIADLGAEAERNRDIAARFGVDNVNSTRQVIAALEAMGEDWDDKTDSGARSVGKGVLLPMADLDLQWERNGVRTPNPLADAIVRAKRAKGWGTTYGQAFMDLRDDADRIHPFIKALAARTARMSVSTPPLQQLPSSDYTIRRAIIADPGNVIMTADYKSMELRVLAALADIAAMKDAILHDRDLHGFTAELIYGPDWTPYHRKLAKGVGLGKVFGGGATTLAKQIGAPYDQVKYAVGKYDQVYPEVPVYSRQLQREARRNGGSIITPFGRHLPLDSSRTYAAVNYAVQSTARDLIAKALVDIDRAGLIEHVMLPVHDELVCQAPKDDAPDVIRAIAGLMESTFNGVFIAADIEDVGFGPGVHGKSWGHGPYMQKALKAGTVPAHAL